LKTTPAIFFLLCAIGLGIPNSRSQDWHADHWGGWSVPTITNARDIATLPIPTPSSNIRLVSMLTTTNTLGVLNDLTGKTISATVWMECSNSPVFVFGNGCGGGLPANMRLFLTTDMSPYNVNAANINETGYWWSSAPIGWAPIAPGITVLQTSFDPTFWSDSLGHWALDPKYTAAFQNAVQHVAQIGLSFGGGCFFDVGIGVSNAGASATLHILQYEALPQCVPVVDPQ